MNIESMVYLMWTGSQPYYTLKPGQEFYVEGGGAHKFVKSKYLGICYSEYDPAHDDPLPVREEQLVVIA